MQWFNNLKIGTRLISGFVLVALIAGLIGFIGIQKIHQIDAADTRLYEKITVPTAQLLAISTDFQRIRVNVLYVLRATGKADKEKFAQSINTLREEINKNAGLFEKTLLTEEGKKLFADFNKERGNYYPIMEKVLQLSISGNDKEGQAIIDSGQLAKIGGDFNETIDKLVDAKIKQAKLNSDDNSATADAASKLMTGFAIAGVLIAIALGLFITRTITAPINKAVGVANSLAQGDLTVEVPLYDSRDELSALLATFRRMVENLRTQTLAIHEGVNVLASSSGEILASSSQVASSASETASAVNETTATVEEVKQTSQLASQKVRLVAENAQKSLQVSQQGKKSVEDAVQGMNRIREQMETIAESIVNLSEQGQAIGEIIATVNDLAEQSNLLAVNAAIEAAKAGEHGKGFAVVAHEVRSLAVQSKEATAQVRTILNDIQKATNAAVMATEQGSKAVEAGERQSGEAGEAIRLLADSIADSADASTQIAASSHQQMVGMEQVAQAMENIKEASILSVTSTRQAEQSAQNLHELGQKLKGLVERFKL
jgi:methyl-accepting chemotaxis protein